MRLFLAIDLPPQLRAEVERRTAGLRPRLPAARWVPARNLHLTLVFLGEQPASAVVRLREELAPAVRRLPVFRLRLSGAGAFPPGRPARVAWLGVDAGEPVCELQGAVEAAAGAALGLGPERRPFHPHLTVARCRRPWGREAVAAWQAGWPAALGEPFAVERTVLYRSHLGPAGADYEAQDSYPLEVAA